jgi:ABC-type oligopeptide transport system substrate-binding subunit
MSKRFFVFLTLSISCALLLAACGGSETTTTNSTNATTANKSVTTTTTTTSTPATTAGTPATTSTPATTTTTAGSGDKIGVAECDDYLTKYEACLTTKVPEAARAQFNSALAQTRASWRQIAATAQGKAGLAQACKMAADQTKQSMKTYGCEF